jgi:hypothetical protein
MEKKKSNKSILDFILITSIKIFIIYKTSNYLFLRIFFKNTVSLINNDVKKLRPFYKNINYRNILKNDENLILELKYIPSLE